jgi:hypothetical protein
VLALRLRNGVQQSGSSACPHGCIIKRARLPKSESAGADGARCEHEACADRELRIPLGPRSLLRWSWTATGCSSAAPPARLRGHAISPDLVEQVEQCLRNIEWPPTPTARWPTWCGCLPRRRRLPSRAGRRCADASHGPGRHDDGRRPADPHAPEIGTAAPPSDAQGSWRSGRCGARRPSEGRR